MLTFLASAAMMAASQPISGTARAGDGDSLTIGATRIRLFGIDAPELNQTCQRGDRAWSCGQAAAETGPTTNASLLPDAREAGHEMGDVLVGAEVDNPALSQRPAYQTHDLGTFGVTGAPDVTDEFRQRA